MTDPKPDNAKPGSPFPYLDSLLVALVSLCESPGAEIVVTLQVHGATITGTMIGGRQYFAELGPLIELTTANRELAPRLREAIESWGDEYPDTNPLLLHLRGAQIMSPSGGMPTSLNDSTLMRIRLVDVEAFSLGRMEARGG